MTKHAGSSKKRALVIEDEAGMAELLTTVLEDQNYSVQVADNGISAYGLVESERFDVITIDVDIPFANGRHLVNTVRKGMNRGAKVFVITGSISENLKKDLADFRVTKILSKPFRPKELLEQLG